MLIRGGLSQFTKESMRLVLVIYPTDIADENMDRISIVKDIKFTDDEFHDSTIQYKDMAIEINTLNAYTDEDGDYIPQSLVIDLIDRFGGEYVTTFLLDNGKTLKLYESTQFPTILNDVLYKTQILTTVGGTAELAVDENKSIMFDIEYNDDRFEMFDINFTAMNFDASMCYLLEDEIIEDADDFEGMDLIPSDCEVTSRRLYLHKYDESGEIVETYCTNDEDAKVEFKN